MRGLEGRLRVFESGDVERGMRQAMARRGWELGEPRTRTRQTEMLAVLSRPMQGTTPFRMLPELNSDHGLFNRALVLPEPVEQYRPHVGLVQPHEDLIVPGTAPNIPATTLTQDKPPTALAPSRPLLSLVDPDQLPDTQIMNLLLSVYVHELEPLLVFLPFPDPAPLVRLCGACFATRWMQYYDREGRLMFRRAKRLLELTLAGSVALDVDTLHAGMLLLAYLSCSSESNELIAAHGLRGTLAKLVKESGFACEIEANQSSHYWRARDFASRNDKIAGRQWVWFLYCLDQLHSLCKFEAGWMNEGDLGKVGLPIPGKKGDAEEVVLLDHLKERFEEFREVAVARHVFLHWLVQRIVRLSEEVSESLRRNGGNLLLFSRELFKRREEVLEGLLKWFEAECEAVMPGAEVGDEVVLLSSTWRASYERTSLTHVSTPTIDIPKIKQLTKRIIYRVLVSLTVQPRHETHVFANFAKLELPPSEWRDVSNKLRMWLALATGKLTCQLIERGHDAEVVKEAVEVAAFALECNGGAIDDALEILPHAKDILILQPRLSWFLRAATVLEMVIATWGEEPLAARSWTRVRAMRAWFEHPTLSSSWPVMKTFEVAYNQCFAQVVGYKVALVAADNGGNDGGILQGAQVAASRWQVSRP